MDRVLYRTGYSPITDLDLYPVKIFSINGGDVVRNKAADVDIVGFGFGVDQGTVTYNAVPLLINTWTENIITVTWPNIPFNADYRRLAMPCDSFPTVDYASAPVLVTNTSGESDSFDIETWCTVTDYYDVITSTSGGSIYADDTDVNVSDRGYIEVQAGAADSVDAATGVLSGILPSTRIRYAVWDTTSNMWSSAAIELFNGA